MSGREFCLDIPVTDDEVLEDTETYTLSLTSIDDDVVIATPTASLIILDTVDGNIILTHKYTISVTPSNVHSFC